MPFLLAGLDPGSTERPWDEDEFGDPADVAELDQLDAAALLKELWDGEMPSDEEDEQDGQDGEPWKGMRAPFSKQFPGLAPAEGQPLSSAELQKVLGALPAARIGLVPASRPADVLPLIGWQGTDRWEDALVISAVLRSWEDRFGARLLQVGFAEIRLLAERPPRSIESIQRLAAEQMAYCDECAGEGLRDIAGITEQLLRSPVWTFWWD